MCTLSMVMDHYNDSWSRRWQQQKTQEQMQAEMNEAMRRLQGLMHPKPIVTQQEVDEFHRLLDRAREYDRKMGQPDCELAEKRESLSKLATLLGIEITFVESPATASV